jgi:hypothetical protein
MLETCQDHPTYPLLRGKGARNAHLEPMGTEGVSLGDSIGRSSGGSPGADAEGARALPASSRLGPRGRFDSVPPTSSTPPENFPAMVAGGLAAKQAELDARRCPAAGGRWGAPFAAV